MSATTHEPTPTGVGGDLLVAQCLEKMKANGLGLTFDKEGNRTVEITDPLAMARKEISETSADKVAGLFADFGARSTVGQAQLQELKKHGYSYVVAQGLAQMAASEFSDRAILAIQEVVGAKLEIKYSQRAADIQAQITSLSDAVRKAEGEKVGIDQEIESLKQQIQTLEQDIKEGTINQEQEVLAVIKAVENHPSQERQKAGKTKDMSPVEMKGGVLGIGKRTLVNTGYAAQADEHLLAALPDAVPSQDASYSMVKADVVAAVKAGVNDNVSSSDLSLQDVCTEISLRGLGVNYATISSSLNKVNWDGSAFTRKEMETEIAVHLMTAVILKNWDTLMSADQPVAEGIFARVSESIRTRLREQWLKDHPEVQQNIKKKNEKAEEQTKLQQDSNRLDGEVSDAQRKISTFEQDNNNLDTQKLKERAEQEADLQKAILGSIDRENSPLANAARVSVYEALGEIPFPKAVRAVAEAMAQKIPENTEQAARSVVFRLIQRHLLNADGYQIHRAKYGNDQLELYPQAQSDAAAFIKEALEGKVLLYSRKDMAGYLHKPPDESATKNILTGLIGKLPDKSTITIYPPDIFFGKDRNTRDKYPGNSMAGPVRVQVTKQENGTIMMNLNTSYSRKQYLVGADGTITYNGEAVGIDAFMNELGFLAGGIAPAESKLPDEWKEGMAQGILTVAAE